MYGDLYVMLLFVRWLFESSWNVGSMMLLPLYPAGPVRGSGRASGRLRPSTFLVFLRHGQLMKYPPKKYRQWLVGDAFEY